VPHGRVTEDDLGGAEDEGGGEVGFLGDDRGAGDGEGGGDEAEGVAALLEEGGVVEWVEAGEVGAGPCDEGGEEGRGFDGHGKEDWRCQQIVFEADMVRSKRGRVGRR